MSGRLVQLVMPSHVEDLLRAALVAGRADYLTDAIQNMQIVSSVPLPPEPGRTAHDRLRPRR